MTRFLIITFFLVISHQIYSQTVIHSKDGRSFPIPLRADEISSIEFNSTTGVPSNIPQTGNQFIGNWARSEGGKTVEYMEIRQNTQDFEILFRNSKNGSVASSATGQLQNNNLNGISKTGSRKIYMKVNSQGKIEYTSTNVDGKNPWSCSWFRVE